MDDQKLQGLLNKIKSTQKLLKIEELKKKLYSLEEIMNAPNFWSDKNLAQKISQDYQEIKKEVDKWEDLERQVTDLIELAASEDKSLEKEIDEGVFRLQKQFEDFEFYLLLNGPYDPNNAIVAIHAGSGGTEAQDWAEMLLRMILRFCEKQGWSVMFIRVGHTGLIKMKVSGRFPKEKLNLVKINWPPQKESSMKKPVQGSRENL